MRFFNLRLRNCSFEPSSAGLWRRPRNPLHLQAHPCNTRQKPLARAKPARQYEFSKALPSPDVILASRHRQRDSLALTAARKVKVSWFQPRSLPVPSRRSLETLCKHGLAIVPRRRYLVCPDPPMTSGTHGRAYEIGHNSFERVTKTSGDASNGAGGGAAVGTGTNGRGAGIAGGKAATLPAAELGRNRPGAGRKESSRRSGASW